MFLLCVLFLDELILAAMTDDVGGCFDLFNAFKGFGQQPVDWHDSLAAGSSHQLGFIVMKIISFSCVLFMDELILAAMTYDVG
jgi:hypothetical protein